MHVACLKFEDSRLETQTRFLCYRLKVDIFFLNWLNKTYPNVKRSSPLPKVSHCLFVRLYVCLLCACLHAVPSEARKGCCVLGLLKLELQGGCAPLDLRGGI